MLRAVSFVSAALIVTLAAITASATGTTSVTALVREIGVNIESGNETAYVRIDQTVSVDEPGCAPSDLLKFNLSNDERAASTRFAQQILLSAALDGRPVRLVIPTDRCLYGNPTIVSAWLVAR